MKVRELLKILKTLPQNKKVQMDIGCGVKEVKIVQNYEKNELGWEIVLEN